MNYYPFNSRSTVYKNILGAVASGQPLTLRLLLHNDARVHNAYLRLRPDNAEYPSEIEMQENGQISDYRIFETEITLNTGLYWYDFRYTSDFGDFFVKKTEHANGVFSKEAGECWQQTVYDNDFKTPTELAGGIIYHIFPDRFCASGQKKQNVPNDRYLVDDWYKTPEHRQTGEKNTLGNDYFGGDLKGIESKLDYLKDLGVTVIYLNPVFEAHSNHRYNTADYLKIDSILGTEEDFKNLCKSAEKCGIKIILDGVFSHTGDDSIYFNKYGRYESLGAYQSDNSPYRNWYKFGESKNEYSAWWGIKTLPETDETNRDYLDFICKKDGVLNHWLNLGADGFRLDVADELPDLFLEELRKSVKENKSDAFILGEVWEDASNKISYGSRRKFLLGKQLDSVMNYPFANGIISFIRNGDGQALCETVESICENYPKQSLNLLMNHIGTHDTVRVLTALSRNDDNYGDRENQAKMTLSEEELQFAKTRLKAAAVLQYTLPGIPSLFYGDEAGLTGGGDPFCRKTYPWGREDTELIKFYKELGKIRRISSALKFGDFVPINTSDGLFCFERKDESRITFVAVNTGDDKQITLPENISFKHFFGKAGTLSKYEYLIAST